MKAAYITHRDNAKRRGKEHAITFDEFKKFAIETKYFVNKGKSKTSLHIDRIDEMKGYTIDNIQVLPNCENVYKYVRFKEKIGSKVNFETITVKPINDPNLPF
jgi:hypothetical protein